MHSEQRKGGSGPGPRRVERPGLLLIVSSLVAIAVVTGLVLRWQRDERSQGNRAHALSLVQLLSSLPYERLVPGPGQWGPLHVVKTSERSADFAYATVASLAGQLLAQSAAEGVIAPPAAPLAQPSAWVGERQLALSGGRAVQEFFAPVLVDGEPAAQVAVGFFEPGYVFAPGQASLLGMLALPVFLLTPLAWFLIRSEVRPVTAACRQLHELADERSFAPVQVEAEGQLGEFVRSFNRFVELAGERVRDLESRQTGMLASSRVLTYQKGRMESVLEALPDATLVLDETGAVTFANAKLESILGVPPESALGRKPVDWCPESEIVAFLANYQGPEPRLRRSDAIELSPEASPDTRLAVGAHPLAAGRGEPAASGTLVLLRDVTAEALARRAQGEFVTHVAHELKSPLNVMAMYSESLLGKDGEREEFRIEACNVLQDEVERVSMLVSTLLSIARIETGAVVLDRQRVRLQDLLRDALDTVSRGGRKAGLTFELNVPNDLSPIQADKELLRVAVNNLLTNAIKYNREGGRVELVAEEGEEQIAIRVRDTGVGISDEDRRCVFEKFYRSEDPEAHRRGGHGLGLALAREIAELHGGEIAVESQLGEGSTFTIALRKTPVLMKDPT